MSRQVTGTRLPNPTCVPTGHRGPYTKPHLCPDRSQGPVCQTPPVSQQVTGARIPNPTYVPTGHRDPYAKPRLMPPRLDPPSYMEDEDSDEYEDGPDLGDPGDKPVPIWLGVMLVVVYILGGAVLFSGWEDWDFLDSVYFCFITLTTIGESCYFTTLTTTTESGYFTTLITTGESDYFTTLTTTGESGYFTKLNTAGE